MALGTIAPWLQLPNFQQAAEAGARIGQQQKAAAEEIALGRERIAQAAEEAAGRLGLGYAELGASAKKADADRAMAEAAMRLKTGRYSDLSKQAEERHQLGEERLDALGQNRDVVNQLHQDQLDSLNDHRDEVDALRGKRLPAAGGAGGTPGQKTHMVSITIPGVNGGKDRHVSLPSDDPRAQEYLDNVFEKPITEPNSLYQSPASNQSGETLPLPGQTAPDGMPELQPRNLIYTGTKGDAPPSDQLPSNMYMGSKTPLAIRDPGTMPAETLAAPVQAAAAQPVLSTGKKRFRFDPATGKFDPIE